MATPHGGLGSDRAKVAALASVVVLMALQWISIREGIWADVDVYVLGAQAILDGEDLYDVLTAHDLPFTYPPFAAGSFVPLALLPTEAGRVVFTLISLASLAMAVVVVSRHLGLSRWWQVWLVVAALAIEPVLRTLLLGQINAIIVALVVVDVVCLRRSRGMLVGVAAGIKLTPAVFVLMFLLERDLRSIARAALGFALTVAVGFAIAPSSSAHYWSGGFMDVSKFGTATTIGTHNQSLYAALLRLTHSEAMPAAVQVLLLVVGVALGGWAAHRALSTPGATGRITALAALALGGLLGSPISWSHHWIWVIVVAAVLLAHGRVVAAHALVLVFWFPTVWLVSASADFGELDFPWWRAVLSAIYVVVALVILVTILIRSPHHTHSHGSPDGRARWHSGIARR